MRAAVVVIALLLMLGATAAPPEGKGGKGGGNGGSGGNGGGDAAICDEPDLDAFAICMKGRMGSAGSGAYQAPSNKQRDAWQATAETMLGGACPDKVPKALRGKAETRTLDDHCILLDVSGDTTSTFGWGYFITAASPSTLHLEAPHPRHDLATSEEAVGLFQSVGAASVAVAGAHRDATPDADMAHETGTIFDASLEAALAHDGTSAVVLQFHGMAATSCPDVDVYVTAGEKRVPGADEAATRLRDALRDAHPWSVTTYGDSPPCGLHGSTNDQGPLVRAVGGEFIHAEQSPGFRDPTDWTGPLLSTGLGR